MANEMRVSYQANRTVYFMIFNRTGQIWNTAGSAFETYQTANVADYGIAATPVGSASSFYTANFPSTIVPGTYDLVAKQQLGGTEAEADPTIGVQAAFQWNGSAELPLSDLVTSGQLSQVGPIRIARGVMVQNFLFYMKSSADHITPFVSGVVSGQIARDNGAFGALQSGAFTEVGNGFYRLQALTSGDVLCNTFALLLTGNGISGGSADPVPFTGITQRVSGQ